mmetsp:Transcript_9267/g.14321  ORF Transcript_9267/g.14321 Transcript_9267/m.14321 type:complete len:585 (+) Transcript_9267:2-1756(+)
MKTTALYFLLLLQCYDVNGLRGVKSTHKQHGNATTTKMPTSLGQGNSAHRRTQKRRGNGRKAKAQKSRVGRWFIEYNDDEKKNKIKDRASRVIKEFPGQNTLVVEISEYERNRLSNENIITSSHQDAHVEASGSFQRVLTDTRDLTERTSWGIKMIQADQLELGPNPVKCCIIDTGYALGHPDLPTDLTGDDAVNKFGDVMKWDVDMNGHGTHIAGVISALSNNDIGVKGAGDIPLHITRGLDDKSGGFESDIIDAIDQCIKAGSKIINISLGSSKMSPNAEATYTRAVNEDGVMIMAAAGNRGALMHEYPASHPDVISVAAVTESGKFWERSNFSDQVEIAAPGHAILSTTTTLTAVHTSDFSWPVVQVAGSRSRGQRGTLIDCGLGDQACNAGLLGGGICLMARDQLHLKQMVKNCVSGGGKGAIVFDAVDPTADSPMPWVINDLPVILVSKEVGADLKLYVGSRVSIGYHESDEPEHTYAYFEGTSMAVPHVVSAAALVWSHFPECSNHEIRYALAISAADQENPGCDVDYGYGIVKAKDAYDWLSKQVLTQPCGSGTWGQPRQGGGCKTVAIDAVDEETI